MTKAKFGGWWVGFWLVHWLSFGSGILLIELIHAALDIQMKASFWIQLRVSLVLTPMKASCWIQAHVLLLDCYWDWVKLMGGVSGWLMDHRAIGGETKTLDRCFVFGFV